MSTTYDPRPFIASVPWVFARTMAHYNPHEYIVESRHRGEAFDAFVAFVRTGAIRRYRGGRYHCVTVEGFDYFLTYVPDAGWLVNRKRTEVAGWDPEPPPTSDSRERIWHDAERGLIDRHEAEALIRALDAEEPDEL
jgi:hypothetical protein